MDENYVEKIVELNDLFEEILKDRFIAEESNTLFYTLTFEQ